MKGIRETFCTRKSHCGNECWESAVWVRRPSTEPRYLLSSRGNPERPFSARSRNAASSGRKTVEKIGNRGA